MRPLKNRASAVVALVAGGVLLLGAPAVYADTNLNSEDNAFLSGNQAVVDVDAPVTNCATGVVLSAVECDQEVNTGDSGRGDINANSEENSFGSGNQVVADVDAPVTNCATGAAAALVECDQEVNTGDSGRGDRNLNSEENSFGSGNQVVADVDAPVTNCATAVAASLVECDQEVNTGDSGSGDTNLNSEDNAFLSGNQVVADIDAPVTNCGTLVLGAVVECDQEVNTGDRDGGTDGDNGHEDDGDNGHKDDDDNGHKDDDNGDHGAGAKDDKDDHGRPVTAGVAELPHTGVALVLVPLGLALLTGGALLRRRLAA